MKLKKKHFKKLKEIAVAVNQIVPGTGVRLDKLIAEIESVQKVKTVQERPLMESLSGEGIKNLINNLGPIAIKTVFRQHRKDVENDFIRRGEAMVDASTDDGTHTEGLRKYLSDSTDWKPLEFGGSDFTKTVDADPDPKIGDVGK